jgi:hypothetical protein
MCTASIISAMRTHPDDEGNTYLETRSNARLHRATSQKTLIFGALISTQHLFHHTTTEGRTETEGVGT